MILRSIKNRLEKLSENDIDKLAEIMDIGFLNDKGSIDKDDKILVLSTEPKEKIIKALRKLK